MGKYKDLMVNTGLFAFTQIATKLITFFSGAIIYGLYVYRGFRCDGHELYGGEHGVASGHIVGLRWCTALCHR